MYHIFISARTIGESKAPIKPPAAFDVRNKVGRSFAGALWKAGRRLICQNQMHISQHLTQFGGSLTKGKA